MTYFPAVQYHRQRWLNCCVRDGNRCLPALMFTDKPNEAPFDASSSRPGGRWTDGQTGRMNMRGPRMRDRTDFFICSVQGQVPGQHVAGTAAAGWYDRTSTVSTAQLKAFLPVHSRPINLVVYQGSFVFRLASLISRGASHLDAFSGYPCRT
jgi:hypothetical protein